MRTTGFGDRLVNRLEESYWVLMETQDSIKKALASQRYFYMRPQIEHTPKKDYSHHHDLPLQPENSRSRYRSNSMPFLCLPNFATLQQNMRTHLHQFQQKQHHKQQPFSHHQISPPLRTPHAHRNARSSIRSSHPPKNKARNPAE